MSVQLSVHNGDSKTLPAALKDDLTQAPNRRAIVQRCKKELEQAKEQNRSLAQQRFA